MDSTMLLMDVISAACAAYCAYTWVRLLRERKLFKNELLLGKDKKPEDCLDEDGYVSYVLPRLGVLTVILSLFLLFNQWFTMMSLPFLFTLWLLFSGISRFVSAFDLRAFGVRGWGWILTIGIILMVAGFICMMDPWVSVAAIGLTVGLAFLLEGVSAIVYACIPQNR